MAGRCALPESVFSRALAADHHVHRSADCRRGRDFRDGCLVRLRLHQRTRRPADPSKSIRCSKPRSPVPAATSHAGGPLARSAGQPCPWKSAVMEARNSDALRRQYEMHVIEAVELLKFDFLGVSNLTNFPAGPNGHIPRTATGSAGNGMEYFNTRSDAAGLAGRRAHLRRIDPRARRRTWANGARCRLIGVWPQRRPGDA